MGVVTPPGTILHFLTNYKLQITNYKLQITHLYLTHWRIAILLIFISISVTAELSKGLENQYP
jgi:hypothetical protein